MVPLFLCNFFYKRNLYKQKPHLRTQPADVDRLTVLSHSSSYRPTEVSSICWLCHGFTIVAEPLLIVISRIRKRTTTHFYTLFSVAGTASINSVIRKGRLTTDLFYTSRSLQKNEKNRNIIDFSIDFNLMVQH